jgi:UDP-N-acetylmuramoylalanine-D-glutamate ligase
MEEFVGLPHRLERVTTKSEIIFYDDAISTTPESTVAAIRAIA